MALLDELGWLPQKKIGGSANSVFKTINGLAQLHFKGILIDAYKGTR